MNTKNTLSIIATALIITACGGGGGGAPYNPPVATPTTTPSATPVPATPTSTPAVGSVAKGVYLDSAIEGIEYTSASKSGTTNAAGEFDYVVGEEITFKLWGRTINTTKGGSVVTPADMSVVDINKVLTVLMIVQSVDTDSNPSNGITLPVVDWNKTVTLSDGLGGTHTRTIAQIWADVDFTKDPYMARTTNASGYMASFVHAVTGKEPVGLQTAADHFAETIGKVTSDVVLSLAGKTATSVVTADKCDVGGGGAGYTYTFGSTGYTKVGNTIMPSMSYGVITCGLSAVNSTYVYGDANEENRSIPCGTDCKYSEINRMHYQPNTKQTGEFITLTWYNADVKTLTFVRMWISTNVSDPIAIAANTGRMYERQTYKEVIQF